MMGNDGFSAIVWMFIIPALAIILPVWLGQRYGIYSRRKSIGLHEASIGSAVGATLGLLAFMLGFTFQIVGNRFDRRKELMVKEISTMRACYNYAGLIPEPLRSNTRKMIVEYVDIRVQLRANPSRLEEIGSRSRQILDSLWKYSENLGQLDHSSENYALYIESVAELVNYFHERIVVVFQARLPKGILYVLSVVAFFSMIILGYHFGTSGKVGFIVILLLGVTFAAVLWLIYALDHPESGLIQLGDAPLRAFQQELHSR